jgi:N,N-dimethylformamidase
MWQFPADLHLIDWLHAEGFEFEVATDHDVEREGATLLRRYNVVTTGTHPEYVSTALLDAWEDFLSTGGRGMYLAANGFYWVTSVHPDKPWLIEVRKGETGTQAWRARPGEYFHGFTGERGGLWRQRARAPQKIFGTGMSSHGLDVSTGYVQLPDARDPRVAWILDGIEEDEVIGDFGLVNEGAAGLEMDIIDPALGTPPHVLLLASSHGHNVNAVTGARRAVLPARGHERDRAPAHPGGPRLLHDAAWWRCVQRVVHDVVRKPVPQRLRQQRLTHHRQCADPLRGRRAPRGGGVRRRRPP